MSALASFFAIAQGGIVPSVPDPRTPMPAPGTWRDPGYLKVVWIQSPNMGPRPSGTVVDTVVVHATVEPTLEGTTKIFQRSEAQTRNPVSAHYTIGRDGSIVQNVSTFDRSWHAGVSKDPAGRTNLNNFSVGIELVNLNDGKDPWPDAQVQALAGVIAELKRRFPMRQILSHEYIAVPVGRKSDPREFPWERLRYLGLPMYYGQNVPKS